MKTKMSPRLPGTRVAAACLASFLAACPAVAQMRDKTIVYSEKITSCVNLDGTPAENSGAGSAGKLTYSSGGSAYYIFPGAMNGYKFRANGSDRGIVSIVLNGVPTPYSASTRMSSSATSISFLADAFTDASIRGQATRVFHRTSGVIELDGSGSCSGRSSIIKGASTKGRVYFQTTCQRVITSCVVRDGFDPSPAS